VTKQMAWYWRQIWSFWLPSWHSSLRTCTLPPPNN